jgi:hypothetical protein
MEDWSDEESQDTLAKHRPDGRGLLVKLDQGFKPGAYGVCIDYRGLSSCVGLPSPSAAIPPCSRR